MASYLKNNSLIETIIPYFISFAPVVINGFTFDLPGGVRVLNIVFLLFPLILTGFSFISVRERISDNFNVALVIGNGFDLDLGLGTSYLDFYKSDFWPFKNGTTFHNLGRYLNKCAEDSINPDVKDKLWFSLEDELAKYGSNQPDDIDEKVVSQDKSDYYALVKGLREFILNCQTKKIEEKSFSYQLLTGLRKRVSSFVRIFSFNYTDIGQLFKIDNNVDYMEECHIHGSVCDSWDKIILGAGDYCKTIKKEYNFLYKSTSPGFNRDYNIDFLSNFDVIIFMGHSLSKVDYVYFGDLFKKLSENDFVENQDKKILRIYTNNDASADSIWHNIREMNDHVTQIVHNSSCQVETTEQYYRLLKEQTIKQHPEISFPEGAFPSKNIPLSLIPSDVETPNIDIIDEIVAIEKSWYELSRFMSKAKNEDML